MKGTDATPEKSVRLIPHYLKNVLELFRPHFLCLLAEAYMETGRLDDGLGALREGLAAADEHEDRVYEAETHRA